ncbi:hypothetical protein ABZ667_08820 [Streptomyces lavendulae]|uniref:hypothetical protein n=1 Tax=Streptomyces lavendulae TaxID=1914 RepID=UPI0033CEEF9B
MSTASQAAPATAVGGVDRAPRLVPPGERGVGDLEPLPPGSGGAQPLLEALGLGHGIDPGHG